MPDRLKFFLDWEVNCQFAGLIRAQHDGLFSEAGIDLRLVPPSENPHTHTLDLVLEGGLCVGCMEDNLIVRAAVSGKGVKAIGATMQDTPIRLLTLPGSGIRSLADVPGRRIAMHKDGIHLLKTILALHGIDSATINATVANWTLDQLADGTFDAVQGYATTEPHALARRGVPIHLLAVQHRDLHPWAQMMFTTDAVIAQHGDVLQRFVSVCKSGWHKAMTDIDATASLVASVSAEHDDPAENRRILALMLPLIAGERGLEHCVATDPDRWGRNLVTYARFGMIDRQPAYKEVVCDQFM